MLAVMVVLTVLAPRAEPYEQQYSEDVDITPWALARPVGIATVVVIAVMYVGFWAKFGVTPGKQLKAEYEALHPPAAATAD